MDEKLAIVWQATDPRTDETNRDKKRCSVIVSDGKRATVAHCEMHHGWQIALDEVLNGINFLGDSPNWPTNWRWISLPK